MRWFWFIVVLLASATAWLFRDDFMPPPTAPPPPATTTPSPVIPPETRPQPVIEKAPAYPPAEIVKAIEPAPTPVIGTPAETVDEAIKEETDVDDENETVTPIEDTATDLPTDLSTEALVEETTEADTKIEINEDTSERPANVGVHITSNPPVIADDAPVEETNDAEAETKSALASDTAIPEKSIDEVIPSTFVTREDGSTLVDDRFIMRGTGTEKDPYVITWDMLMSASETYDPREKSRVLHERFMRLDGNWVKVTGYVAFPIVAEGLDEMLVMLNQWDGCCVGLPPTPYDAVEVTLTHAATPEEMLMSWGTVTGRFTVEPFLAGNWLIGLYLMEEARLSASP